MAVIREYEDTLIGRAVIGIPLGRYLFLLRDGGAAVNRVVPFNKGRYEDLGEIRGEIEWLRSNCQRIDGQCAAGVSAWWELTHKNAPIDTYREFYPRASAWTKERVIETINERRSAKVNGFAVLAPPDFTKLTDVRMQQFVDDWQAQLDRGGQEDVLLALAQEIQQ